MNIIEHGSSLTSFGGYKKYIRILPMNPSGCY